VVVIDGKGCLFETVGEAAIGIVGGKKPLAKDVAVRQGQMSDAARGVFDPAIRAIL